MLAIIFAGSRQAVQTWDPTDVGKFLMAVTMARSLAAGAPIFATPGEFVKAMSGAGPMGQILTMLQIKPVIWDSAAETAKMISTESKMFSIYADGIVPGYQRKTRVRVHAVVDFRNAPPPGTVPMMPLPGATGMPGGLGGMPAGATGALAPGAAGMNGPLGAGQLPPGMNGQLPPGATPDAVFGALLPNPAGTIVYWRIE
jgi:general secretion pathway protein K